MKLILIAVTLVTASCVFAQQPQLDTEAATPVDTAAPAASGRILYYDQAGEPIDMAALFPSNGEPIAAVLGGWAKKFGKTLVVEPRLVNHIKLDPAAQTFEQGLDLALKPYENVTWRKVYLRAKVEQPKPDRLAAMVRTMVAMEATGIIVQDPATSKIGSFVKSVDVPEDYESGLSKMNPAFAAKAVYVVFDSKPKWMPADGLRLLDLTADPSCLPANAINAKNIKAINQQMIEAMKKMDPESRAKVMKGMLDTMDGCSPRTRIGMYVAGLKLMERMTPEERETLRRRDLDRVKVMTEMGAVRTVTYINGVKQ